MNGALDTLRRLREQFRQGRGDEGHSEPAGGWAPALDDESRVIPEPLPDEPTDVSAQFVEDYPPE
jgi:hypothetical protein